MQGLILVQCGYDGHPFPDLHALDETISGEGQV
jgi:hypothetical protein